MGSVIYIPKKANPIFNPEYGALYNWYAATDVRGILPIGWHVPIENEYATLSNYLGGNAVSGIKLKTTAGWGNYNGTNESGFSAKPSGIRGDVFQNLTYGINLLTTTLKGEQYRKAALFSTSRNFWPTTYTNYKYVGTSIRPLKDSTTLTHGQTGTYTGNDGKVYRTICIGTQEWLADSLCETRFRNGDIIPWHGADPDDFFTDVEWAALTTAGVCAYGNDVNNVATGFTFP